ncbi:hypothetical protein AQEC111735_12555 [Aquirufa ecclesiirivi]
MYTLGISATTFRLSLLFYWHAETGISHLQPRIYPKSTCLPYPAGSLARLCCKDKVEFW